MVRRDLVARKVSRAATWLDDAAMLLSRPFEEYQQQPRDRDLAAFYLMLGIQECIDIAAHWVADEGWGSPDDAAGAFDVLADRGVIEHPLANVLHGAVGLRNRIAHGYARLDHERIHAEATGGLTALRGFLSKVSEALDVGER
jgi:uncharacterized protein YutE (UPF0331/DUF86 family)